MIKLNTKYPRTFFVALFFSCGFYFAYGQNNALILNGAYININGGTWASPVYLIVNAQQNVGIIRNSGHIISEQEGNYLRWNTADVTVPTNYVFPFGYSTTDYIPVTIHKTSVDVPVHVANNSAITISTWSSIPDNTTWANTVTGMFGLAGANATNSAIDRWWQVRSVVAVTATADFSYRGVENTTAFPFGTFAGQEWYNTPPLTWDTQTGSGVGVTAGIGTVTGITLVAQGNATSTPYILTASVAPLPIELISFTAVCEDNKTNINWKNASETNLNSIELQKSTNLSDWTTIYIAQPSNQSTITNYDYSYTETNSSTIYYRLKINNNDNSIDLSTIVFNHPCNETGNTLTAFYYNNSINVHTYFLNEGIVNYTLYDIQGKIIFSDEYKAEKGDQLISLPINELSNSVYFFSARNNDQIYNRKIVISR